MSPTAHRSGAWFDARDCSGTVTTEYVAVLVLVALGLSFATHALGPKLVALFALQRAILSIPTL